MKVLKKTGLSANFFLHFYVIFKTSSGYPMWPTCREGGLQDLVGETLVFVLAYQDRVGKTYVFVLASKDRVGKIFVFVLPPQDRVGKTYVFVLPSQDRVEKTFVFVLSSFKNICFCTTGF